MVSSTQPRTFVTGATGRLGQLVIQQLLERVSPGNLVAGTRSQDHKVAKQFTAQGVEVRVADYNRVEMLSAAFKDIDQLLLISSSAVGERTAQHKNVIDAAKVAGVGLLIYTSMLHADASPLAMGKDHLVS